MVKPRAKLALASLVAAAVVLVVAAVWLWVHNVIIVAAPVAFLAVGCAWAGIDNALIYPKERSRREATQVLEPAARPGLTEAPEAGDSHGVTAGTQQS